MAYPTAEQVQNAYGLNLQPATAALGQLGETLNYQMRVGQQQKQQQKAQQLQGLGLIAAATDPLTKGTGFSPLDDMNALQIGQVKNEATKMLMAGSDPVNVQMFLDSATVGMKARQDDARKALALADAHAKHVVAGDEAQDYTGIYRQYVDNIFYSKDDKGNKVFNPSFNPSADFTVGVQPVFNEVKLKELAAAEIPKLFPERETPSVPSPNNPLIKYSAKAPAYHTVDPASGRTVWNTRNITLKGDKGKTVEVPVLADDGIVAALYSAPNAGRYLQKVEKEIRASLPKTVSDEDVKRIVATDYIQQHGHQPGAGVKEDDNEFKRQQEANKLARDEDHWQKGYALSLRGANRADANYQLRKDGKANVQQYVSPYDITTAWATDKIAPNSGAPASELLKIHTHVVNGKPLLDVNGLAEKDVLTDPDTGNPIKVIGFKDGTTRSKGYQVMFYKKATPVQIAEGSDVYVPVIDEATGLPKAKTVVGPAFNRYHTALAPQLQLDVKKKNYNATINSAADLSE